MALAEIAHDAEVVEGLTLEELAATANREHGLCEQHLLSALPHAINAGKALMAAHAIVERGGWEDWLSLNFTGSAVLARLYVRLSFYESRLEGQRSIKGAREAIAGLPPVLLPGARVTKYDTMIRNRAVAMVDEGMPEREVADVLGVGRGAIQAWRNPQRAQEHNARQAAARRALRDRERQKSLARAVRAAGAAVQEAYSMAERFQDVIAQAQREVTDTEAKAALSRASVHHRKMRDEIVRALGIS